MAVVKVLERLGLTVEYLDGQTCCGQPAFNSGAWDDARAMARHTLDVLARDPRPHPLFAPNGASACRPRDSAASNSRLDIARYNGAD